MDEQVREEIVEAGAAAGGAREKARVGTVGRVALIVVGTLSVLLGALGIFLPLLPTTPFLLLAAACFLRSSDRCYRWLIANRWFGRYIRDYREQRGVRRRVKIFSISLLWLAIGYSVLFVLSHPAPQILLIAIAACVTTHILSLKTLRD